MIKSFVFGKFLPFHKGHERMIRFALSVSDVVSVLVCASDKESISGEQRKKWIDETLEHHKGVDVRIFPYNEDQLPNTSESSREVAEVWSRHFKAFFPDHQLVVTSEQYGEYVAEFMGIRHVSFDSSRTLTPVSATMIRENLRSNWGHLPDSVKRFFSVKVVILGTESTGKTTLTENLARYFQCPWVPEAAREIIADSKAFRYDDLLLVARGHAGAIQLAMKRCPIMIVIDTDIHITKSYSREVFGKELEADADIMEANRADVYLYLANDVPYIQDGTRLEKEHRDKMDLFHRTILQENDIVFVEISGNWKERLEKAVNEISRTMKAKSRLLIRRE